jgi:hypothetical protein
VPKISLCSRCSDEIGELVIDVASALERPLLQRAVATHAK